MRVGCAERVDIALAEVPGTHQFRSTPGKDGPVLSLGQHIRHQACVAAIAVGEGMDGNQAVMKADGEFIGSIGRVFEPIAGITQ